MNRPLEHPYMQKLLSLKLPTNDYAIAGSGPLFIRHWIDDPGDIDVVARGAAWDTARQLGETSRAPYSSVQRIQLFDRRVEILDGWFPEVWSVDAIIDEADVIDGIRFVRLSIVVATKRWLRRDRDLKHLKIMEEHGLSKLDGLESDER